MKFGIARDYVGDRITVTLDNGKTISAIPQGDINSRRVIVFEDRAGRCFCRCQTEPIQILQETAGLLIRPREEAEEVVTLLPFQVLTNDLLLGGDRPVSDLSELTVTLAGVTNIGEQNYLATWYNVSNCNIIAVDSTTNATSISSFPICPAPVEPVWYGYGQIGLETRYYPEENLAVEETGQPLPFDVTNQNNYDNFETGDYLPPLGYYDLPLYPVFSERADNFRIGSKTTTQQQENYNLEIQEDWVYKHSRYGNASDATPGVLDVNAVCIGSLNGITFDATFNRETQAQYSRTTNFELNHGTELWLNGQVFQGDRLESYSETYSYSQSPGLFISSSFFSCTADPLLPSSPGFWTPISSTANWTQETTEENRSYIRTLDEPDWDYPVSFSLNRPRREVRNISYESQLSYVVDSGNWVLGGAFPSSFQFEVPGAESTDVQYAETQDLVTPELLLLGATGLESIFSETITQIEIGYISHRERSIPKFLATYTTEIPAITLFEQTEEVEQQIEPELYYCDGGSVTKLNWLDTFCFKISSQEELSLGSLNLISESGLIATTKVNFLTQYSKNITQATGQQSNITYTDVESTPNPILNGFVGREVYAIAYGFRATGTIAGYNYTDVPNPDLEIEINREISSITIQVDLIEDYPLGLVKPGEILIFPVDNASALVAEVLLQPGNKEFCNLVGSRLYFAKSVIYNLQEASQTAEVYEVVGNAMIQGAPEEGQFIPLEATTEAVKSVSYYPI